MLFDKSGTAHDDRESHGNAVILSGDTADGYTTIDSKSFGPDPGTSKYSLKMQYRSGDILLHGNPPDGTSSFDPYVNLETDCDKNTDQPLDLNGAAKLTFWAKAVSLPARGRCACPSAARRGENCSAGSCPPDKHDCYGTFHGTAAFPCAGIR
jgi:hypothetical protein